MHNVLSRIRLHSLLSLPYLVLYLGLATWLFVYSMVIGVPVATRQALPETDDAYGYINSAAQMKSCIWQDCVALQDLRAQVDPPTDNPKIAYERNRTYNRTLLVYTPLHSAILLGLNQLGLSWEVAYQLICYLAIPFFGLAFAYWLRSMWGIAPAGIAMGILAPQIFSDQGLHYVVPSNLALGIAALMWGRLIRKQGYAPWTLTIGTLLLITLHPIGRIYAVMAILISIILAGMPRTRREWLPLVLAFLFIVFISALPYIIEQPSLNIRSHPYRKGETWLIEFNRTLKKATGISKRLTRSLSTIPNVVMGAIVLCGAILFGYTTRQRDARVALLKITALFVAVVAASLFVVRPRIPASMFERLSISLVILLTGAIGHTIWSGLEYVRTGFNRLWFKQSEAQTGENSSKAGNVLHTVLVLIVVPLLFYHMVSNDQVSWYQYMTLLKRAQDIVLEPEQVDVLLSRAQPGDRVLYIDRGYRDFYLTHGATQLGAVFQPALAGSDEAQAWFQRPDLRFAVLWNPVGAIGMTPDLHYLIGPGHSIATEPIKWMQLETRIPPDTPTLKIWVENQGPANGMYLVPLVDGQHQEQATVAQDIPAHWSGWVTFDLKQSPDAEKWDIGFLHRSPHLFIGGMVFGDDPFRWPWNQKAILRLTTKNKSKHILLDFDLPRSLASPLAERPITVLDDRGSTVLVEIKPEP